ncbi:MAG TPA: alpha/beta fold hydrolase [Candidatus Acidoferrum sp.]
MKRRKLIRGVVGVSLCVIGFFLARVGAYRETAVLIDAGGCRMVADVLDKGNDATQGSVVLFHGLAANKKVMSYIARGFAEQNLRVFVPDLPGHGRTEGPFSFERAESCAESFFRQLVARRAIDPARTILAGHSMGGAIAARLAARNPVAGVVTISPAPMAAAHGIRAAMLLYQGAPAIVSNTLVISASGEPSFMRDSARDLVAAHPADGDQYLLVPHATHVSLLFDSRVARASEEWARSVLHLDASGGVPSGWPLLGGLLGLAGLLILAGPFLREIVEPPTGAEIENSAVAARKSTHTADTAAPSVLRGCMEVLAVSVAGVLLLRVGDPLRFLGIFEGTYFASFLLIAGIGLLLVHYKTASKLRIGKFALLLATAFGAVVLFLLVTGWLDLTITEAWLNGARWARFPVMACAVFPYHLAEELLLGSYAARSGWRRVLFALLLRLVAGVVLVGAIFLLHSGAILLVLLALYFVVVSALQRAGMDVVRKGTGSALAAAVFGAILLAGFCLVIFPIK